MASVQLSCGSLDYEESGLGPPVVFIGGIYVHAPTLWHDVVGRIRPTARCLVPLLPIGGHNRPVHTDADLSPEGVASLIPEFLDALDLEGVTLVGNDTGGGLCQIAIGASAPGIGRIARLVLTNSDSFEFFPPPGFEKMVALAASSPAEAAEIFAGRFSAPEGREQFLSGLARRDMEPEWLRRLLAPMADHEGVRADAMRFTGLLNPRAAMEAEGAMERFDRDVLLVWGDDDSYFPLEHARRLEKTFPRCRLHVVRGAKCFVMIDAPEDLSGDILRFMAA